MNINVNGSPERDKQVLQALPEQPINTELIKAYQHAIRTIETEVIDAVERELEVYRNFPKINSQFDVDTFDPRDNEHCFMGQAFYANGQMTDSELNDYRKAVGTFEHPTWGDCTVLEIWGAGHFKEHKQMVLDAFNYGSNNTDTKPDIKAPVNIFGYDVETHQARNGGRSHQEEMSNAEKAYCFDMGISQDQYINAMRKVRQEDKAKEQDKA